MKLSDTIGNVVLSDNTRLRNYRIKANQHSFKQLYGGLYSQEVNAIIRELSTNAADAHVKAGKTDVPFEIHLPNELEPFFSIKDYGTGLSPEQIDGPEGIYITFFDSDKTNSDDFTGCLGLGSKSPFAYTDNFIVESRYNGRKYLYANLHNEKGEPCIAPMGDVETDEPNGLKVEFAVKTQDFEKFYTDAANVLSWFKIRPTVTGYSDFAFTEHAYLRKSERYGVCKEHSQSYVVMGNVAYPINNSDLYYSYKISEVERKVIEHGVHLFVDIGDVEFVPSREKLKMSDKTVAGVKRFMGDAIKSIQEELETQVQQQPSIWKARCMLHDIKHSILGKVRSMTTVEYNGKEISEYIKFKHEAERDANGVSKKDALGNIIYLPTSKLESISLKKEHYRRHPEDMMYCNGNRVYLMDLERGSYARILNDLRENDVSNAYIVSEANAEFLAETGIGEVAIRSSSLPQPERKQREKSADGDTSYVKRTVMQQYCPVSSNYMSEYWKDEDVELRNGGIYVMVSYGQIVDGGQKINPENIKHKFSLIRQLNPDFKLYGIRPAHLGRIAKHQHKWIKLDDYVRKLIKENEALKEKAMLAAQEVGYPNKWNCFLEVVFDSHSTFGQFMKKYREVREAKKDAVVQAFADLNDTYSVFDFKDKESLSNEETQLDTVYPLFEELDWYKNYRDTFVQGVTDYVRGVDNRVYNIVPLKAVM